VMVDVDGSGAGTVTVVATADAAVVAEAPALADELAFDDVVAAGWQVVGPTATEAGGLTVTFSHNFATVEQANVLLASVNGAGGPLQALTLVRDGTDLSDVRYTFRGTARLDGGLNAFSDADLTSALGGSTPYGELVDAAGLTVDQAVGVELVVNLPGDVRAVDGSSPRLDDGSARWVLPLDGSETTLGLTAEARASDAAAGGGDNGSGGDGSNSGVWGAVSIGALVLLIGWVLVAGGFIAFVVAKRRQRAARREAFLATRGRR
jgi:hypothetical protein